MAKTITPADRFSAAGVLLAMAVAFVVGGVFLARWIGKGSDFRRRHARVIFTLMIAGWVLGGAVGVYLLDGVKYYPGEADVGFAGFSMLGGWVIGMIAGLFLRR